jgi:hypothetical protein
MYSSVDARTREIATLGAIGFGGFPALVGSGLTQVVFSFAVRARRWSVAWNWRLRSGPRRTGARAARVPLYVVPETSIVFAQFPGHDHDARGGTIKSGKQGRFGHAGVDGIPNAGITPPRL